MLKINHSLLQQPSCWSGDQQRPSTNQQRPTNIVQPFLIVKKIPTSKLAGINLNFIYDVYC